MGNRSAKKFNSRQKNNLGYARSYVHSSSFNNPPAFSTRSVINPSYVAQHQKHGSHSGRARQSPSATPKVPQAPPLAVTQFAQTVQPSLSSTGGKKTTESSRPSSQPIELASRSSKTNVISVIAKFAYQARTAEELSFLTGEVLEIIGDIRPESNWCQARLKSRPNKLGFIPLTHVARVNSLQSYPWYFENGTRSDAERALKGPEDAVGSFFVRPCNLPTAAYVLSVRTPIKVAHYLVRGNEREGYHVNTDIRFPTLPQFIEYHSKYECPPIPQLFSAGKLAAPQTVGLTYTLEDQWEIPRHLIVLTKKLGEGNFGEVFEAVYNGVTKVAVKTLKQSSLAENDFKQETGVMKRLIHPKVVQLYGVSTSQDPFYIVAEFMSNGDLLSYLKSSKGKPLTSLQLVDMMLQIAMGMAYLESKGFVHRDLAARNVLVAEENICKIADFGFARLMQDGVYIASLKQMKLPLKWTAPEGIKHKEFSSKSDVWAFGITMVEVIEKGMTPYPGMSNSDILNRVCKGYKMEQDLMPHCDDRLYKVMTSCWNLDPSQRPAFSSLVRQLENFYEVEELSDDAVDYVD